MPLPLFFKTALWWGLLNYLLQLDYPPIPTISLHILSTRYLVHLLQVYSMNPMIQHLQFSSTISLTLIISPALNKSQLTVLFVVLQAHCPLLIGSFTGFHYPYLEPTKYRGFS